MIYGVLIFPYQGYPEFVRCLGKKWEYRAAVDHMFKRPMIQFDIESGAHMKILTLIKNMFKLNRLQSHNK